MTLPEGAKPRPRPVPDADTAPYWEAAAQGRLVVQRCRSCDHAQLYGRYHCTACGGPVAWDEASGRGTVYSFTIIRQQFSRSFRHLLPYVVALVDLEEGPRIMTNVVGVEPSDLRVGMPVQVRFDEGLPLFEPRQ
jgi:uncharacterized protein